MWGKPPIPGRLPDREEGMNVVPSKGLDFQVCALVAPSLMAALHIDECNSDLNLRRPA